MRNSSPICVEANLIARLVAEPGDGAVWQRWEARGEPLAAPLLPRDESTNDLDRADRHGPRRATATRAALHNARRLPIQQYDDPALHTRAMGFAARFSLPTAYAAHCLASADQRGAEPWTADRWFANSVRPALRWVHLVGE